ncbi:MAG: hypothetical protein U9R15_11670, partial [Chloroflexota bacterium]|nr:hypothetical protein [Chloroflexota bacterium]
VYPRNHYHEKGADTMYCTALHLKNRVLYRSLSLILVIGLLLQGLAPLLPEQEVWDERLFPLTRRRRYVRRRRRYRFGIAHVLALRSSVLFCRLILVAALLVWSGVVGWSTPPHGGWLECHPFDGLRIPPLAWTLLGLPVIDLLLASLPLLRPDVLKVRAYPRMVQGLGAIYRFTVFALFWTGLFPEGGSRWAMVVSSSIRTADGAWARGEIDEDGTWRLEMEGHIIFTYEPRDIFEERTLLVLFRQCRTPESTPNRPFLRQEWLAEWFGVHQELISRWQKYVREGGLEKLDGEHEGWVVTPEIQQAILDIWPSNFWLSAPRVRERLLAAGHISSLDDISVPSIHRVARETGFAEIRRVLREMFEFTADGPEWRDDVLVERVFELNEQLMTLLREGERLTPQLTLEAESLRQGLNVPAPQPKKKLPYAYQLQRALFGQWQEIDDGCTRCPHCGTDRVRRKGTKPRRKNYRDPVTREWREAEGYCYRCDNPDCECVTFTDYPDGVRLYSPWTMEMMIWGVMVYMRMRTTYRLAAEAVGVSHVTLWRWAMEMGYQTLPVAALFGVVRSSGVVGVDEKWVLVPKNDKPAGKRKRWMYVYMAVDVHTYDLLHIDIYPYNGKKEAWAFLQALKAKGYSPQVIALVLYGQVQGHRYESGLLGSHRRCVPRRGASRMCLSRTAVGTAAGQRRLRQRLRRGPPRSGGSQEEALQNLRRQEQKDSRQTVSGSDGLAREIHGSVGRLPAHLRLSGRSLSQVGRRGRELAHSVD